MSIELRDTISLMGVVERIKPPATMLVDTFFPKKPICTTQSVIQVDFSKRGRRLAPFVVRGASGVAMKRETFDSNFYKPPMLAPYRELSAEDLEPRGAGESVYSTLSGSQRANETLARDLVDLQGMIYNRLNKMAADLLTTGKCEIKGYADDGKVQLIDTFDTGWTQAITPTTKWDQAGATIFDDIKNASSLIQENAGMVPTVMICGKNVAEYMFNNDQIMKWMGIPSVQNLSMFNFAPRIVSPQVMFVGRIPALNLEVYTYAESYTDDDGKVKPFINADDVIIGVPGRGRQLHGAVNLLNDAGTGFNTYAADFVPYYNGDKSAQNLRLTMYSRVLLAPESVDDWACIHTK